MQRCQRAFEMPGSDTRHDHPDRAGHGTPLTALAPDVPPAAVPRTVASTERIVLGVWRPILRTAVLTPNASLADLGATSFELLIAHGELEQRLGRPLPLVWMFECATPAALAARIDAHDAGPPDNGPPDEATRRTDPPALVGPDDSGPAASVLVPIRTAGSGPPFFFTGLGAGVLTHNLARWLGDCRPFYALLTHTVDERHVDHETFVAVASRYVQEIKQVQPTGPYLLGGFCGQGPMVYEMAQQLLRNGDHVAMLAIFDARAPGRSSASSHIRQTLYATARTFQLHAARWRGLEPHHRAAYLQARLRAVRHRLGMARSQHRPEVVRSGRSPNGSQLARRPNQRVLRHQLNMEYRPRRYPGRIVLFVGDDARLSYDVTFGWSALAEGGVDVYEVPGVHTRMLAPPHDESLAGMLAGAIRTALEAPWNRRAN